MGRVYSLFEFFLCCQLQMPKPDILQHFLQNSLCTTLSGQQGITCRLLLKKKFYSILNYVQLGSFARAASTQLLSHLSGFPTPGYYFFKVTSVFLLYACYFALSRAFPLLAFGIEILSGELVQRRKYILIL